MQAAPATFRSLAVLLMAGAALACAGCDPAAGLHGQWQLDTAPSSANPQAGTPANVKSLAMFTPTVEFKADGTCSVSAGGVLGPARSLSGVWRFVKKERNELVIAVTPEGATDEREVRVKLTDDNHLEMPLPVPIPIIGGSAIPFERVKPQ
jgi:hypothetical protein